MEYEGYDQSGIYSTLTGGTDLDEVTTFCCRGIEVYEGC